MTRMTGVAPINLVAVLLITSAILTVTTTQSTSNVLTTDTPAVTNVPITNVPTTAAQQAATLPVTAPSDTTTGSISATGNNAQGNSASGNNAPAYNSSNIEYPPYDGWYNNFAHPEWGAADTALLRLLPPAYGDGVFTPAGANRPNPLDIAAAAFDGETGYHSFNNKTALLVFFGQQLVEEILDAQSSGCPPEYFNIPIPPNNTLFDPNAIGGREIPLLRGRYDARTGHSPNVPREQLNEITPYFDGNLIYGPNKAWTDGLRLFKDGLLAATNDSTDPSHNDPSADPLYDCSLPLSSSIPDPSYCDKYRNFPAHNDIRLPYANIPPPRDHYLKPVKRFFKIGNPRGNENPFLLTFGILWFRYHNFRARQLKANHPDWDDNKLFNEARKWVIAVHQNIVVNTWLPSWLNEKLMPEYKGYNPHIHPQIAHVFQSAAMRFGHTLVTPGVFRRNQSCHFFNTTTQTKFAGYLGVRTCNAYWNPQESVREHDIDGYLMGMASQLAEREDNIITPDLHGHVFGSLDFSRRDLMAVNIQRGRDHGLPDYNTARVAFGLPRVERFEDINNSTVVSDADFVSLKHNPTAYVVPQSVKDAIRKLAAVYNNSMDDVDIWPAGMLETTNHGPGELFRAVIMNQFRRIRDGDRFWFENYKMHRLFTEQEVNEIKNITLKQIIVWVTHIQPGDIQDNVFFHNAGDPCPQDVQLNTFEDHMENCTRVQSFNYFDGNQASYIVTIFFILFSAVVFAAILYIIAHFHKRNVRIQKKLAQRTIKMKKPRVENTPTSLPVVEWLGRREGSRTVVLSMDTHKRCIAIHEMHSLVRMIDFSRIESGEVVNMTLSSDTAVYFVMIRVPKDYDLILSFDTDSERNVFKQKIDEFLNSIRVSAVLSNPISYRDIKQNAVTRRSRQKLLDMFFSTVMTRVLEPDPHSKADSIEPELAKCELTKYEFASVLGLRADATFVTNMFKLVDKNSNGLISFRELLDFFIVFAKGTANEKAKLMFDMNDLDGSGTLTKQEFIAMLTSLIELSNENVEEDKIADLVNVMFANSGFSTKPHITFQDFQHLLTTCKGDIDFESLSIETTQGKVQGKKRRETARERIRRTLLLDSQLGAGQPDTTDQPVEKTINKAAPDSFVQAVLRDTLSFFENYRKQIFWVVLYTLVVFGIFIERAYVYAIESETSGLRRTLGYGVSITRGAASAMMFAYSSLLVTMCRNLITYLRNTFLHRYIPFDDAVSMHKYIAYLAGIFTLVHIIGHCFNFYGIVSQTANDLTCLFRLYKHATHEIPTFTYWCWQTITGLTGMGLTLQFFLIQVFSTSYARRYAFRAFWIVHLSYPLYFILTIFHGAGRMIQAPYFYYFMLGPVILFTLDQLVSLSRRKTDLTVVRAELLPSSVTYLEFKRPLNFEYKSGQWIRLACLARGRNEFHPLTLTSAPHEENLKVHIRAVGPWTMAMRKLYDPRRLEDGKLPKVRIDGPFGEGNQEWPRYQVSILIGGGIGVTPYASILKDISNSVRQGLRMTCKKVYFIWVTRTQSQFEWLTDILREVEEKDRSRLINIQVFITQFKERFDIRTTMLYICEKHFQKISSKSLFTGLKAPTHFGRPDFPQILRAIRDTHTDTTVFGVFSCGPPPMTQSVEKACAHENKYTSDVIFEHHEHNI